MRRTGIAAATLIAAVAVAVIAVPAASAGVVKYDTKVTMFKGFRVYHGDVHSEARKCKRHRRVVPFKQRPGADGKFATAESGRGGHWGDVRIPDRGRRGVYAEVKRKVLNDGDVCRADRTETRTFPTP